MRAQGLSGHAAGGDFCQRTPCGFGDEGDGARGARVDFEHVDVFSFDGKLRVHEPDDVECVRERFGLCFDALADSGIQTVGRQGAGGVAGVDAGFFDVFH